MMFLMLLSASANAEWTSDDTKRQAIFTGVLALDWAQTRYIAKHPDNHSEINVILGDHPSSGRVDGYFASSALIHFGISYILPDRYRRTWQNVSIAFETGMVIRNYKLGIGFSF